MGLQGLGLFVCSSNAIRQPGAVQPASCAAPGLPPFVLRAGQPTSYREEFCDRVVEVCGEGYSLTGFAGKIGVCRDTILEWTHKHPEFSLAVNRAKAARAAWWEDRSLGVAQDGGSGGQATLIIFGLKNHAPEDYADVSRHEHSGKDGKDLIPEQSTERTAMALMALVEAARRAKGEPE